MKFGIITYAVDLAALAQKAEELGFDQLWAPEHNTTPVHIAPMNSGCLLRRIDLGPALLPGESLYLVTQCGCDVGHSRSSVV